MVPYFARRVRAFLRCFAIPNLRATVCSRKLEHTAAAQILGAKRLNQPPHSASLRKRFPFAGPVVTLYG